MLENNFCFDALVIGLFLQSFLKFSVFAIY